MMLIAHVFGKCEKLPPCEFAHGRADAEYSDSLQ